MADYFDPSPRSSKRRRTATPNAAHSVLDRVDDNGTRQTKSARLSKRLSQQQDGFEDSAYSSKEDSLVEDESGVVQVGRKSENIHNPTASGKVHIDKSTSHISEGKVVNKELTPSPHGSEGERQDGENTITVQPRSSGRERRRPRRYSISPEKPKPRKSMQLVKSARNDEPESTSSKNTSPTKAAATPKGILTPSRKGKRVGPRKSVIFDHSDRNIEDQFGFRDINNSVTKTKSTPETRFGSLSTNQAEDTSSPTVKKASQQRLESSSALVTPSEQEQEYDDLFAELSEEAHVEPNAAEDDGSQLSTLWFDNDPATLKVKSIVLNRLVSGENTQIPGHIQGQYDTLHSLLRATVTSGESNSILLLGAKGAGKSHLLNSAISALSADHVDDFHTVRLNGFYQTDDKVALREIWRQLGREMQVDEMESGEVGGSYADTMSSLLSLLSHPDEFIDPPVAATGNDLMEVDAGAVRTSKSVIFILDEFDLFTTHPRQTLLYNLFDIAQSRKAPIAVVGCSTRMDVVDCLEKRVKSRFSHRWLHIASARTLDSFNEIVKNTLCVELDGVAVMKLPRADSETRKVWNEYIQSTFLPSSQVQDLVRRVFYTSKSIPELFSALYVPVATLQLPAPTYNGQSVITLPEQTYTTMQPALLTVLPSLPTLHLALLIAASRLDTIHNLTTLNFNLVYAHYVELISRSKLQVTASGAVAVGASLRQWSNETAISAWEDLGLYECIVPVSGAAVVGVGSKDGSSTGGDVVGGESANVRMWRLDVTLDDLGWVVKEKWSQSGGVKDVLGKWCREI